MADPLSIAASVVGLLAAAGKIGSVLSGFVSSVADAPQSARDALAAATELRFVLESVKGLLDVMSALPSNRKMLVRLDHIAVTFSNCVLTVSELESLVCPKDGKDGVLHRFKWTRIEKKVLRLLQRLEAQKTSMSLMVSVLIWYGHSSPFAPSRLRFQSLTAVWPVSRRWRLWKAGIS
jgi:hypothetical protein